jgi:hypothetical protein
MAFSISLSTNDIKPSPYALMNATIGLFESEGSNLDTSSSKSTLFCLANGEKSANRSFNKATKSIDDIGASVFSISLCISAKSCTTNRLVLSLLRNNYPLIQRHPLDLIEPLGFEVGLESKLVAYVVHEQHRQQSDALDHYLGVTFRAVRSGSVCLNSNP